MVAAARRTVAWRRFPGCTFPVFLKFFPEELCSFLPENGELLMLTGRPPHGTVPCSAKAG